MDAVDYLVVYFISESSSETKLAKTILFYAYSEPTCAIPINFETMYVLSKFFIYQLMHNRVALKEY